MEEVFKASFDDRELIEKLDKLEKQVQDIGKAVDTVGDTATQSLNQAAGAADNFTASIDAAATDTAKQAKAVEQARAANQSWLQSIRQTIAGQQLGGKSLGEWAEQARGFSLQIAQGAKSITGASSAMRIFSGVLKASGIGLLVGLVGSLIQYFTKFQGGIDKVSQVMASLNAVVNVLVDRFLKLGSGLLKIVSGDIIGGARDMAAAFIDVGGAIADAAVQAFNLEKRLQALRDITITQSVEAARARVELEKFRQVADDGTRSINERARAAKSAAEIEKQLAEQAVDRALEAQQIAQGKFALDKSLREETAKAEVDFQEAVANLNKVTFDAEKEQREFRKEAAEERRKQQEEELKKAEALRKEYEKLFADIQKQAEALNIENTFNPVERVIKQYQAAIDQTKLLRERLLTIAPGEAEKARVNEAIEALFDELAIKYREELNAAEDELNELKGGKIREALIPLPPAGTIDDDLAFRAKSVIQSLQNAAQEAIDSQQPRTLAQILGISEGGLEGIKDATDKIIDSISEIADAQLKAAEEKTRQRERDLQEAQEFLIRQQELAAEGLANDTDLAKQQVARQKELRDAALKEEAKAVRTQILLDSAQQISSLITAAANIFKGFSLIPLGGQILAIASITAMFAAFAKAKSDALKAAAIPKFRKGVKLQGRSHEQDGIDMVDHEGRVVGQAEGDEWLVGTGPSREHDRFLARLNEGEFAGVNLDRMFSPSASNPITEAAPRIERIEREFREIRETQHTRALESAYREAARDIVTAIQEKEVVTPLTNYRITKKRGRNTFTKVVREEK